MIYVKEYEGAFRSAQQLEIEMTPDRVQKKIVEIPHDELQWAKKADLPKGARRMYIGENGMMTEEEWLRMEAQHATPFLENYASGGFPSDRMIIVEEEGHITEYPLDWLAYMAQ